MLALSFTRCIVISFVAKAHMLWAISRHFPPSSLISPYDYYSTPRHKPRTSSQQQAARPKQRSSSSSNSSNNSKKNGVGRGVVLGLGGARGPLAARAGAVASGVSAFPLWGLAFVVSLPPPQLSSSSCDCGGQGSARGNKRMDSKGER